MNVLFLRESAILFIGMNFWSLKLSSPAVQIVIAMIRKSTLTDMNTAPLPIQQAIAYLNVHFLDKISLVEPAVQLSFSPNYLGHLFKMQIGCTFNDYLNTLRLKYACSLLLSSNTPVKEIVYTAGYSSVEYFMYVFKKRMHMTPGTSMSLKIYCSHHSSP